jgi:hypothetical protein
LKKKYDVSFGNQRDNFTLKLTETSDKIGEVEWTYKRMNESEIKFLKKK